MRVLTVVGARPQFIKAAPVSIALRESGHREYMVHTGQHYDYLMSRAFFEDLPLPEPDVNLEVGSGPHGAQTGRMMTGLEAIMVEQHPDCALVYGDTNSTLAGALVAAKLHIPLAHVEAGLRAFNRSIPEEINRITTDHCADRLFCPTATSVANLEREGITQGVELVGDTMYDAVLRFFANGDQGLRLIESWSLKRAGYLLATIHRPANTDQEPALRAILSALSSLDIPVIFPVHPRTRARMREFGLCSGDETQMGSLRMIEPLRYRDMLHLEKFARLVLTDSGGVQKEAFFFEVPCVTLRDETEWTETLADGWNVLVRADAARISQAVHERLACVRPPRRLAFGDGRAAERIARSLGSPRFGRQ